jgi:hypothetical protein
VFYNVCHQFAVVAPICFETHLNTTMNKKVKRKLSYELVAIGNNHAQLCYSPWQTAENCHHTASEKKKIPPKISLKVKGVIV